MRICIDHDEVCIHNKCRKGVLKVASTLRKVAGIGVNVVGLKDNCNGMWGLLRSHELPSVRMLE